MKTGNLSKRMVWLSLMIVITFVASACEPKATPTSAAEVIATRVAQTIQAKAAQDMQETLAARMTQQSVPTNTATIAPTFTPAVLATPIPLPTSVPPTVAYVAPLPSATSTTAKLCLQAGFVSDVTIPDGTTMEAGKTFTKTWKFQNTGTCTWTPEFDIFFVSGDQMGAPSVVDFPATVAPGGTVEISIPMTAPASAGTYTGYWTFADQGAVRFGTGTKGTDYFSVKIVVK